VGIVFENRVLRRIFGPKRGEVTRERRKLHINPLNAELNPICHLLALIGTHHIVHISGVRVKELNDLYCSPNIIRMIKSMGWAGHVARMGRGELHTEFERGSQREREKFIRKKAKYTRHDYKIQTARLQNTHGTITKYTRHDYKIHTARLQNQ